MTTDDHKNDQAKPFEDLNTLLTTVSAWAEKDVPGEEDLGLLIGEDFRQLRQLLVVMHECSATRFEASVHACIEGFKRMCLSDLGSARRGEALIRHHLDVASLIPNAYRGWVERILVRLETALFNVPTGEPDQPCPQPRDDGYAKLIAEYERWRKKLATWRKNLDRRRIPLDNSSKRFALEGTHTALFADVEGRLKCFKPLLKKLRTALDGALQAVNRHTGGHPDATWVRRTLVRSALQHPLSPSDKLSWDDLVKRLAPTSIELRSAARTSTEDPLIAHISTITEPIKALLKNTIENDGVIVDLLVGALGRYLKEEWLARPRDVAREPARVHHSTLDLYALLRLLFSPDYDFENGILAPRGSATAVEPAPPPPPHRHESMSPHHPQPTTADWPRRARVTVIGGGIAGLTAAHELVERGFDVQVVEKDTELTPDGGQLALGGVARTQWAVVATGRAKGPGRAQAGADGSARTSKYDDGDIICAWPVAGMGTRTVYFNEAQRPINEHEMILDCMALTSEMLRHWGLEKEGPAIRIEIRGHSCIFCGGPKEAKASTRYCWAVLAALTRRYQDSLARKLVLAAALFDCGTREPIAVHEHEHGSPCPNRRVEIRIVPDPSRGACFVPGEHGYRFFPSFYRHMRDTMKRIPLYDASGRETERTAHDNLVPTYTQVFARPGRTLDFTRARPRSLESFRSQLKLALVDLKFNRRDLHRFSARIFRYLATGRARREAAYEGLSWWEFLTLKEPDPRWHDDPDAPRYTYSAAFERQLKAAPQALVAMDAEFCDARTQGNIVLQLLLDQFLGSEHTDSTLNGPTTDALFTHWRRHLHAMGVRFYQGNLDAFDTDTDTAELVARWGPGKDKVTWPLPAPDDSPGYQSDVDYYVLATDVVSAERVTRILAPRRTNNPDDMHLPGGVILDLREYTTYVPSRRDLRLARAPRDGSRKPIMRRPEDSSELVTDSWRELYERYEDLPAWEEHPSWAHERTGYVRDPDRPIYGMNATDRLQTFSGVQFYFRDDFQIARGHAYFQETPWGLSAISQMQFWRHKQVYWREGIRGILSVDIGSFYTRSTYLRQPAHRIDGAHLAKEVWRQIYESLRRGHEERLPADRAILPLPQPFAYHVDDWLLRKRRYRSKLQAGAANEAGRHEHPAIDPSEEPKIAPWRRTHGISTTTPFLVNNVGDWVNRPGAEPWDPSFMRESPRRAETPQVWQASHGGYQVHYDKLVFAGSYTKTFTRMTTMEAANESARHAVNAILDHVNSPKGRTRLLGRLLDRKQAAGLDAALRETMTQPDPAPASATDDSDIKAARALQAREIYERNLKDNLPNLTEIDAAIVSGDYCKIWDPERHELDDFEFLRRVDDMLFEAGKPHMFDILGVDDLVDRASPESDPLEALLSAVGTTVQHDWSLGNIKDGGGLKLLRDLGERLRQTLAGGRDPRS